MTERFREISGTPRKTMYFPRTIRRQVPLLQLWWLLLWTMAIIHRSVATTGESVFGIEGHSDCPCVESLDLFPISELDHLPSIRASMADDFDETAYGLGCGLHDRETYACTDMDCFDIFPRAASLCDKSWCHRAWCYIDPTNCTLLKRRSYVYPNSVRFFSYAPCGQMDYFTKDNRIASLEGKTMRVAFNSNSGGWMGSYATDGQHFGAPIERWRGPMVEFIKQASYHGQFGMKLVDPPSDLRNRSNAFFSPSSFDFCVYAVALGYLDMCIADYTITSDRASTTDFMVMDSASVFLIAETTPDPGSSWHKFQSQAWKAFAPLSVHTWLFIALFVLPVFSVLMAIHEYGQRGSTFPSEEKVVVHVNNVQELHLRPVPFWKAIFNSLYHQLLSTFLWAWTQPVVTTGAKLNLLGISFFTLTTLAAYTANLAAIFGQTQEEASIQGLDQAIEAGIRFCAERKNMQAITEVKSALDPSMFVVDPPELGGDGQPGFHCEHCQARRRVFEQIDPVRAENDARYCHAALAPMQDLEVLQSEGRYCDLVSVGSPVHNVLSGFPVAERVAPALMSFFLKLQNEGVSDEEIQVARPASLCPVEEFGEGTSLSIAALSGIWIVTALFIFSGLFIRFAIPCLVRTFHPGYSTAEELRKRRERPVLKRDQNGLTLDVHQFGDDRDLLARSLEQMSYENHLEHNQVHSTLNHVMSGHIRKPSKVLLRSTELTTEEPSFHEGSGTSSSLENALRPPASSHLPITNNVSPCASEADGSSKRDSRLYVSHFNAEVIEGGPNEEDDDDDDGFEDDFAELARRLRQRLQPR